MSEEKVNIEEARRSWQALTQIRTREGPGSLRPGPVRPRKVLRGAVFLAFS